MSDETLARTPQRTQKVMGELPRHREMLLEPVRAAKREIRMRIGRRGFGTSPTGPLRETVPRRFRSCRQMGHDSGSTARPGTGGAGRGLLCLPKGAEVGRHGTEGSGTCSIR